MRKFIVVMSLALLGGCERRLSSGVPGTHWLYDVLADRQYLIRDCDGRIVGAISKFQEGWEQYGYGGSSREDPTFLAPEEARRFTERHRVIGTCEAESPVPEPKGKE